MGDSTIDTTITKKFYNAIPLAEKSGDDLDILAQALTMPGLMFRFLLDEFSNHDSPRTDLLALNAMMLFDDQGNDATTAEYAVCMTPVKPTKRELKMRKYYLENHMFDDIHDYCGLNVLDTFYPSAVEKTTDDDDNDNDNDDDNDNDINNQIQLMRAKRMRVHELFAANPMNWGYIAHNTRWVKRGYWVPVVVGGGGGGGDNDDDDDTVSSFYKDNAAVIRECRNMMTQHLQLLQRYQVEFNDKINARITEDESVKVHDFATNCSLKHYIAELVNKWRLEQEEEELPPPIPIVVADDLYYDIEDDDGYVDKCDELADFVERKLKIDQIGTKCHVPPSANKATCPRHLVVLYVRRGRKEEESSSDEHLKEKSAPKSVQTTTTSTTTVLGMFNIVFAHKSSHVCDRVAEVTRDILSNLFDVFVVVAGETHRFPNDVGLLETKSELATLRDHPLEATRGKK
jgi:hypothetical protein